VEALLVAYVMFVYVVLGAYWLVSVIVFSRFFPLGSMILGVALFVAFLVRVLDKEKPKAVVAHELAVSVSKWPFASIYVLVIPVFSRSRYEEAIFWFALVAGFALDVSLQTLIRRDRRLRNAIVVLVKWLCAALAAYGLAGLLNAGFGAAFGGK